MGRASAKWRPSCYLPKCRNQAFRCSLARCDHNGPPQRRYINGLEANTRATSTSPRSLGWHEGQRVSSNESLLLLRRQDHHAVILVRVSEGREDFPIHPEIGMVHMRAFR